MNLQIFQVDAFTSQPLGGNPAAVCPLRLFCELNGKRVKIGGNAALYLKGEIYI